jgi:hypothetical protein
MGRADAHGQSDRLAEASAGRGENAVSERLRRCQTRQLAVKQIRLRDFRKLRLTSGHCARPALSVAQVVESLDQSRRVDIDSPTAAAASSSRASDKPAPPSQAVRSAVRCPQRQRRRSASVAASAKPARRRVLACAVRALVVHHHRVDFAKPLDRDAFPLLDGEWMLGGFEFDRRPNAVVTKMDPSLQVQHLGGTGPAGWPATRKRADVGPFRLVEGATEASEAGLAERYPDAPTEGLLLAVHRDIEASWTKNSLSSITQSSDRREHRPARSLSGIAW